MAISDVHEALLNSFRNDDKIRGEFSRAITGTVSTIGKVATGTSTTFMSILEKGDYIGSPILGYRKVADVVSDTSLTLESGFADDIVDESLIRIDIKKGAPKVVQVTRTGKTFRVVFMQSKETELNQNQVMSVYMFMVVVGFFDDDEDSVDAKKSSYEKWIRDRLDNDATLGDVVIGNTQAGMMHYLPNADVDGLYFGMMPIRLSRNESRGNR